MEPPKKRAKTMVIDREDDDKAVDVKEERKAKIEEANEKRQPSKPK